MQLFLVTMAVAVPDEYDAQGVSEVTAAACEAAAMKVVEIKAHPAKVVVTE